MKNILFLLLFLCASASLGAQCISFNFCEDSLQICDYTPNDGDLWRQPYWLDPQTGLHDLTDAPVDISITATDVCGDGWELISYILYLDLDGDGLTMESWNSSQNAPAAGTLMYNNPGFVGGESRIFDSRPVPADQKYQFAVDTVHNGNAVTAYLRWNTPANPDAFKIPEFPTGRHKIKWIFRNNLGIEIACETFFEAKDCKKPTIVCINGLSVNLMPTGQISLWASDFLQYGEDNATPTNLLDYSIRKSNTGTGFPVDGNGDPVLSVTFDCTELGTQIIELWARDLVGNADYCETYVIVQDNFGNCPGGGNTGESPVVVCLNGNSIQLLPNGTVSVPASAVLHAAYDDHTPSNLLDLGIRRSGTGTGFPVDGQGNPVSSVSFQTADLGVNLIEIWARDEDGNADYCETYVIIEANQGSSGDAPTIVCINGLSVNLMPTGSIQLWATDFLQYVVDDLTPTPQIQLGIRKGGTGTGFPVDGQGNPIQNVVYSCSELGTQVIELWARDLDGNSDYCETYVVVQDNLNNCASVAVNQTVCINRWCDGAVLSNVSIPGADIDANGCFQYTANVPPNYTITPHYDGDPLNGVTPLDLVKISRHILGLEPLSSYAIIAADANKSNSVTTFDIVESRKLIQGIYNELPSNTSWRFVDADYVFPNPNNPFQGPFPETITITNTSIDSMYHSSFIAVKIGDVDCDGTPGVAAPAEDRQVEFLTIPDATLAEGETVEIPLSFSEAGAWLAMQAGFLYDPQQIEIEAITSGNLPGLEKSAFAEPTPGVLNLVWYTAQPYSVIAGEKICTLHLRARQALQLSKVFQLAHRRPETPHNLQAEGYNSQEKPSNFELVFRGNVPPAPSDQTVIFQAQPNPTTNVASIPIRLAQAETVQLALTDISGKLIWHQALALSAGMQVLEIPATALPETGVYFWKIEAGETAASGKLVKVF